MKRFAKALPFFFALVACTIVDDDNKKHKNAEPAPFELVPAMDALSWNLFTKGDASLEKSSSEGKIAVLGSASFLDLAVATIMPEDEDRCDLAVKGNLTFTRGTVYQGRICVEGSLKTEKLGAKFPGTDEVDSPLDEQASDLTSLSQALAQLSPQETISSNSLNGQPTYVKLRAESEETLTTFEFLQSASSYITGIDVSAPPESSVVLNFSGKAWDLSKLAVQLTRIRATNVIYNFPEATSIKMTNSSLLGTVIAPQATIAFNQSQVIGSVFSTNIRGRGRFVLKPYIGELPEE
ncbi:MAG: choice-of-anchor A family protein [Oligoflexales bacterium]